MKLAPVLAKYLNANKSLALPGLGIFKADSAYDPNIDYSKKGSSLLSITFEQTKVAEFDEDLINFVAAETGKMKVLAQSDLMSELDSAINFLNTGKPYFINGIGTITKKIDGSFEFHKEKYTHVEKEKKKPIPITEKNSVPQSYIDETRKPKRTKPAIIILILCLLAVAATIWFYVNNSQKSDQNIEEEVVANTQPTAPVATTDSNLIAKPTVTEVVASNTYKYILEIAKQPRASKRYSQLKKINWPIEMQTSDSVNFKLFIQMPIANMDTARIKDSLSALSGRRVWIER